MTEIIPDCGINACGDVETAKKQIDMAKWAGVKAVKFQVYTTEKLYKKEEGSFEGAVFKNPYFKDSLRGEFTYAQHKELAKYAESIGIEWFASVFDTEAVDLCEEIGVKRYKIACRENKNEKLILRVLRTGKPIIISFEKPTDIEEIWDYQTTLYCVRKYPTPIKDVDGGAYKWADGLSDHTIGIYWALRFALNGVKMIEKHFTTDRKLPGCDQICSLEPYELKVLVDTIRDIESL